MVAAAIRAIFAQPKATNPLERLNKEVKRRTDVVGVFPNPKPCSDWPGAVLVEAHDTNGKPPTAATSPKPPWPYSPHPTRRKD